MSFVVRAAKWIEDQAAIATVRRAVFIDEQHVPEALEWEAIDPVCAWFIALAPAGEVIGIARLTGTGRIGRMAVVPAWRRRGVGSALLATAIETARGRGGLVAVHLSAQRHAIPFYLRHGFLVVGPEFLEAGIPHRNMNLQLGGVP